MDRFHVGRRAAFVSSEDPRLIKAVTITAEAATAPSPATYKRRDGSVPHRSACRFVSSEDPRSIKAVTSTAEAETAPSPTTSKRSAFCPPGSWAASQAGNAGLLGRLMGFPPRTQNNRPQQRHHCVWVHGGGGGILAPITDRTSLITLVILRYAPWATRTPCGRRWSSRCSAAGAVVIEVGRVGRHLPPLLPCATS